MLATAHVGDGIMLGDNMMNSDGIMLVTHLLGDGILMSDGIMLATASCSATVTLQGWNHAGRRIMLGDGIMLGVASCL